MADEYKLDIELGLKSSGDLDKEAKKAVASFQDAFKNLNLTAIIESQLSGVKVDKTLSARIEDAIRSGFNPRVISSALSDATRAAQSSAPSQASPQAPAPSAQRPPELPLMQRMQPLLSGLEAASLLLRGGSAITVAQMAGQAAVLYQQNQAAKTAAMVATSATTAASSAVARPVTAAASAATTAVTAATTAAAVAARGRETAAQAIERRLAAIPGYTPAAPGFLARAASTVGRFAGLGAAAGSPGGPIGMGGGIIAGIGAGLGALAISETADAVEELGTKGAKTTKSIIGMSDTMGISIKQLLNLGTEAAKSGVRFEDFSQTMNRTAIIAKARQPEIEQRFADSANVATLANIRISASERELIKARDNRAAATDRAISAEGELVKHELFGWEQRKQQAQAAELGVSGARIGLRGAQIQRAAAGVNLDFAGREAAFADAQGPLSIDTAKLGVRGAELSERDAKARLRALQGNPESEFETKQREIQKAKLAVDAAELNTKQAKLRRQQTEDDEAKRQAMTAAGAGPVSLAQQQALSAEQGVRQAELAVQQAETSQQTLAVDQHYNTQRMRQAELIRQQTDARLGIEAAGDAEQVAGVEVERAKRARADLEYADPKRVKEAFDAAKAGKPLAGYDFSKIEADAFRDMVYQAGEFDAGKIFDVSKGLFSGEGPAAKLDKAKQLELIRATFPERGYEGAGKLRTVLTSAKGVTPEEDQRNAEYERRILTEYGPSSDRLLKQQARFAEEQRLKVLDVQMSGVPAATLIGQGKNLVGEGVNTSQRTLLDALTAVGTAIGGAASGVASDIRSSGSEIARTLSDISGKLQGIQFLPPPISNPNGAPTKATADELTGQAAGGPVYGAGSETSDSIDAKLSHGEYVVQTKAVRQVGIPFLNALNSGKLHFASGGAVEIDERKRRGIINLLGGDGGGVVEIDERKRRGIINLIGGEGGVREIDEARSGSTIELAAGGAAPRKEDVDAVVAAGLDPSSAFDAFGNLTPMALQVVMGFKVRLASSKFTAPFQGTSSGYNPRGSSSVTDNVRFPPGEGPPKLPPGVPPGSEISPSGQFYRDPRDKRVWRAVPSGGSQGVSRGSAPSGSVVSPDGKFYRQPGGGWRAMPPSHFVQYPSGPKTITAPTSREPPPPTKEQMPLDINVPSDYVPKQRYEELLDQPARDTFAQRFPAGEGDKPGEGEAGKEGTPGQGAGSRTDQWSAVMDKAGRPGYAPENDGNKYVTIVRNGNATHYLVGKDNRAKGEGKSGTADGKGTTDFKPTVSVPGQIAKNFDPNTAFKEGVPPLPYQQYFDRTVPKGMRGEVVEKEGPQQSADTPGKAINASLITSDEYEALLSKAKKKQEASGERASLEGQQKSPILGPFQAGNAPINVPPPSSGSVKSEEEKKSPAGGGFPADRFGAPGEFKPGRGGVGPQSTLMPSELQFHGAHVQANPMIGVGIMSALGHAGAAALFGYGPSLYDQYKAGQSAKERAENYETGVGQLKDEFRKHELFKDDPTTSDTLDPKYQPDSGDGGSSPSLALNVPPPPPPPEDEDKDKTYAAAGGYVSNLIRGFANGGFIGDAVNSVPGYASGGPSYQRSSGSGSNLSGLQLDLKTDAGSFKVNVDERTMQDIENSSLHQKLTRTSTVLPQWYS